VGNLLRRSRGAKDVVARGLVSERGLTDGLISKPQRYVVSQRATAIGFANGRQSDRRRPFHCRLVGAASG
jgi:hypothetical protein